MRLTQLINILHEGDHSLVVENGNIATFDGRGIADLYMLFMTHPVLLKKASVVDKVVGKGAAALMVLGKVKRLYAEVISTPALTLLRHHGIEVEFATEVACISNRAGNGPCPIEKLCAHCLTAEACLPLIQNFMMRQSKS